MANVVKLNPEYFPNPDRGRPVNLGSVYVGKPDLDPEIVANQKTLSIQQEDGSVITVSQPISLSAGGVPTYNGSPVTLLVDGDYSLKVLNSQGSQVYYVPSDLSLTETVLSSWGCDIATAITAIGATPTTLVVDCIATIADGVTVTIPSTMTLQFVRGGLIQGTAGGGTETLAYTEGAGLIADPGQQIYGSNLTVTGLKKAYPEWWGQNATPGTTDMSVEMQAAIDALDTTNGGELVFNGLGPYLLSEEITLVSKLRIDSKAAFTFSGSMATKNVFSATSKDDIIIRDITITGDKTTVASNSYGNGVAFDTCDNIKVQNVTITNTPQTGIWAKDITDYEFSGNNISGINHASAATIPAGINVQDNSINGTISDNIINDIGSGTPGGHGIILIQFTGTEDLPKVTTIDNNKIKTTYAHGIVIYSGTTSEIADVVITNNHLEDIGMSATQARGNGIYVLQGRGVTITNNTLKNINANTATAAIIHAAISIQGDNTDTDGLTVISHNNIEGCGNHKGIGVTERYLGLDISHNNIRNCINDTAIFVRDVRNFSVSDNVVYTATGQAGILATNNGAGLEARNGVIANNVINGCLYGINMSNSQHLTVSNNQVHSHTDVAFLASAAENLLITGNSNDVDTVRSLQMSGANVNCRVWDNLFIDRTGVTWPYVSLAGDVIMEFYTDSVPTNGTWTVGSRAIETVPVVGQPKAWSCTVTGTPGTWVSEGNL